MRPPRRDPLPEEFRTVGIDEAGRGPVLGPMVIAICALTARDQRWCARHDVRDSKQLSPQRRDEIAKYLMLRCWHAIAVIHPPEIDRAVRNRQLTLNGLEAKHMGALIRRFTKELPTTSAKIIVDSPFRNTHRFRRLLCHLSGWTAFDDLRAEHKADVRYRSAAAASILAKTERDRLMRIMSLQAGYSVGSGYPGDPASRAYLKIADPTDTRIRWSWASVQKNRPQDQTVPML